MAFNLTTFSKNLRGNGPKSVDAAHVAKSLDRASPNPSFAKILKGTAPSMSDSTVRAFAGNTAMGTRLRGLKLW